METDERNQAHNISLPLINIELVDSILHRVLFHRIDTEFSPLFLRSFGIYFLSQFIKRLFFCFPVWRQQKNAKNVTMVFALWWFDILLAKPSEI